MISMLPLSMTLSERSFKYLGIINISKVNIQGQV
jgi:hypothetical protein